MVWVVSFASCKRAETIIYGVKVYSTRKKATARACCEVSDLFLNKEKDSDEEEDESDDDDDSGSKRRKEGERDSPREITKSDFKHEDGIANLGEEEEADVTKEEQRAFFEKIRAQHASTSESTTEGATAAIKEIIAMYYDTEFVNVKDEWYTSSKRLLKLRPDHPPFGLFPLGWVMGQICQGEYIMKTFDYEIRQCDIL